MLLVLVPAFAENHFNLGPLPEPITDDSVSIQDPEIHATTSSFELGIVLGVLITVLLLIIIIIWLCYANLLVIVAIVRGYLLALTNDTELSQLRIAVELVNAEDITVLHYETRYLDFLRRGAESNDQQAVVECEARDADLNDVVSLCDDLMSDLSSIPISLCSSSCSTSSYESALATEP